MPSTRTLEKRLVIFYGTIAEELIIQFGSVQVEKKKSISFNISVMNTYTYFALLKTGLDWHRGWEDQEQAAVLVWSGS